ncbi:MAG: hypothetical protein JW682_05370 [Campylobacterales bacterium]|nr:hypothetical protein [Campylobacterales bacterium]HEO99553.1 hypothetical protein [Campylobacterota bacterium]
MRLKRVGIGVAVVVIAAVIYTLSLGSDQLTQVLKEKVNQELQTLQSQGFAIEDREISRNREHFTIVVKESEKIARYLNREGVAITDEESASLQGLKIGVDLLYLKDSSTALSFDLYPTSFPDAVTEGELSSEEKEALAKFDALFRAKTFLVHIDINALFNGFKGYVKDIDETLGKPGEEATMQMKAMRFQGEIDNGKISSVDQRLERFLIKAGDELLFELLGITSHYNITGPTRYDTTARYAIGKISYKEASKRGITIENMETRIATLMQNGLADSEVSAKVHALSLSDENQTRKITDFALDMKVSNLDIKSFEALQQTDASDQQQIDRIVQKILSGGLSINIPNLSVDKFYTAGSALDGFALNGKFAIDKNLNLADLQANPMLGLHAISADLNLSFSESFHTFISQQPQALITMMMFRPKEKNGNKVYRIKLQNGLFNVNGVPLQ